MAKIARAKVKKIKRRSIVLPSVTLKFKDTIEEL